MPGAILVHELGLRSHGEPSTSNASSGDGANSNALPNNVILSAQRGVDQRRTCVKQADMLCPNDERSQFMTTMQVSSRIRKLGVGQSTSDPQDATFVQEWVQGTETARLGNGFHRLQRFRECVVLSGGQPEDP